MQIRTEEEYLKFVRGYCEKQKIDGRQNLVFMTFYTFVKNLLQLRGFDFKRLHKLDIYPSVDDFDTDDIGEMLFDKLRSKVKEIDSNDLKHYLKKAGLKKKTIDKYLPSIEGTPSAKNGDFFACFNKILDTQTKQLDREYS